MVSLVRKTWDSPVDDLAVTMHFFQLSLYRAVGTRRDFRGPGHRQAEQQRQNPIRNSTSPQVTIRRILHSAVLRKAPRNRPGYTDPSDTDPSNSSPMDWTCCTFFTRPASPAVRHISADAPPPQYGKCTAELSPLQTAFFLTAFPKIVTGQQPRTSIHKPSHATACNRAALAQTGHGAPMIITWPGKRGAARKPGPHEVGLRCFSQSLSLAFFAGFVISVPWLWS